MRRFKAAVVNYDKVLEIDHAPPSSDGEDHDTFRIRVAPAENATDGSVAA